VRETTRIKLQAGDNTRHCPSHEPLVEVLLALDKRLGRIELWMIIVVVASLTAAGKFTVWPVIQRMAGL